MKVNTIEPDINLYRKMVADITPTEFEIVCRDTLKAYEEASIQYISNAVFRPERRKIQIQAEMQRRLPDYISLIWDGKDDYPYETVYPSEAMIRSAQKEIIDLLKEEY